MSEDLDEKLFDGIFTGDNDEVRGKLVARVDRLLRDERERCALLCHTLAVIHADAAKRIRKKGEYTTRALWPFGKKVTHVLPNHEREAVHRDNVVYTLGVIAKGIRWGWDPRKHVESPDKPTFLPSMLIFD